MKAPVRVFRFSMSATLEQVEGSNSHSFLEIAFLIKKFEDFISYLWI